MGDSCNTTQTSCWERKAVARKSLESTEIFFDKIELKRRSVQSCAEISLFPLGESGSPSAVNNTFLSFAIRDKKPQERGAQ
jgi:hypothetical protein